ncbi:MAG: hypothetical protein A4S09_05785 [Proteobacteria bacterium SG_bin7]|nr:MAG: hypothetical protein A4S09_05785 [Proteobacteria bacterium SG_bin7]
MNNSFEFQVTTEALDDLRGWVETKNNVFSYFEDSRRASLLVSYLIYLELQGPNNNLLRHFYDESAGGPVDQSKTKTALIELQGLIGVRFSPPEHSIVITYPDLVDICSWDGRAFSIFPSKIAHFLRENGVEPVFVKQWIKETLFGSFDPATMKYRDQMWELENNDVLLYAELVGKKQMVFQGIHDVVEHAPGTRVDGWDFASNLANKMCAKLRAYFNEENTGNIPSQLPPYLAGIILDDLTQSGSYRSIGRARVIHELLDQLAQSEIRPYEPLILSDLPSCLDDVMDLARTTNIENNPSLIRETVRRFFTEIQDNSYLAN